MASATHFSQGWLLVVISKDRFLKIVRRFGGFYVNHSFCLSCIDRVGISHEVDDDGKIVLTHDLARRLGLWMWASDDLYCDETKSVPAPTPARIRRLSSQMREQKPRIPVGLTHAALELSTRYSFEHGRCGLLDVRVSNG